ncbi:MAG: NUDIX domain-containing protein [Sporolactobacillus sp.]
MEDFTEKRLESKEIFKGRVVHLFRDKVKLPNGQESAREVVRHPGAVAVIAVNSEEKLLLVRQYRYPLDKTIYEIPAGKLELGENPDDAAARELEEETGYRCTQMKRVASFYSSPGFSDELIHLYFADALTAGTQHLDQDEFLENAAVSLTEAMEMIGDGRIADAKSILGVQFLQLHSR